jgi:thiamine biosynthesis lipoprotein
MTATFVGSAWSCTVRLVVEDDRVLNRAAADLMTLLDKVDRSVSRFRADSELSIANSRAGKPVPVSKLTVKMVQAALDGAMQTDGAVDPTVGLAMARIGYDRDITELAIDGPRPTPFLRARTWQDVRLHREAGLLTVPVGTQLDLGATAKAYTADHAANTLAHRYGTAVMVELGGDLAVAGNRPDGWVITVAERAGDEGQLLLVRFGGVCTSTKTVRTWQRDGQRMHHIVDPTTGLPAQGPWRTATVAAECALAANVASTAAIVKGEPALDWLETRGLAARLVATDGSIHTTSGWPAARAAVAS